MDDSIFRLRINFQKTGRLRYLSHLELARAMERLVRRAQLDFAVSQGFNSHMRFAPGPALPVGTAGMDEYFDVWLKRYVRAHEVKAKLCSVTVDDLKIIDVKYVSSKEKGIAATHTNEDYVMLISAACDAKEVQSALDEFIAKGQLVVQRQKKTKVYDLRMAVRSRVQVDDIDNIENSDGIKYDSYIQNSSDNLLMLKLYLKSGDQGAIKPEVLVRTALCDICEPQVLYIARSKLFVDEH